MDILAGLKHKLGVPHKNKVFRSSKKNEEKNIGKYLEGKTHITLPYKSVYPNTTPYCKPN